MKSLPSNATPERLKKEVREMRMKLRHAAAKTDAGTFDIKQGEGGIVDIEFLVQYLVLRHCHQHPRIIRWTDNVRLLQSLNEAGILDDTTAFGLRRAYLIYRAMVHRLNLRQHPAQVGDDRSRHRQAVRHPDLEAVFASGPGITKNEARHSPDNSVRTVLYKFVNNSDSSYINV